ncbi:RelA/SpoT family protein [Patescibacteria group bacterium]|nr:RelA/SpoT family protein [Patescibacteria group bacterium]MBU1703009.1 RelA/SpoT family protein [Patescibacteria group bacterium]MBU1954041.1 RelA/SpoT family protein [Patescibacteria group bacterium]
MITLEDILSKATDYNPGLNRERVVRAFKYVEKLHENQYRMSGDRHITHVLAVSDILLSLKPDEDTLIASFLHSAPNVAGYNPKEIKELFGDNVSFLVKSLEGLYKVKSHNHSTETESIRKLFVTLARDVRVVLIKMADRLQSMETLSFRSSVKQKQIARETMDVYVPIAARLSIYSLKGQLEDKSFKYLYPVQYEQLNTELDDYLSERESTIEDSIKELKQFLADQGITATVEGRVKNLYSIYRKLKIKSCSMLKDLFDVYAIRIIVPNKFNQRNEIVNDHLYGILGLIHSRWRPLGHRFRDYIAVPKPNGYRSLHTAVIGLSPRSSQPTEIQIRSRQMHEEAEYGIASHWLYDDSKKGGAKGWNDKILDTRADWIKALSSNKTEREGGDDFIDALKLDVFNDRIFVMTPNGEVKDLPKGSTPIDFAYAIHSDLGHRCQLAKVNDTVVPLDYKLKNGEVVEIVFGNEHDPKPSWLSFVKSAEAKAKIRSFLRSSDKESSLNYGKERVNKELSRLGKPLLDDTLSILKVYNGRRLSLRDREGLVEEIGKGSVLVKSIIKKIFGERGIFRSRQSRAIKSPEVVFSLPDGKKNISAEKVCVSGECDLPYRLANCCNPRAGLPIVAYVTRGRSVTIHLQSCKVLRDVDGDRILEASWGHRQSLRKYSVKIQLCAKDRVGLIRDIADVITSMNVNIGFFSDLRRVDDVVEKEVFVDVAGEQQLVEIISRLERIRNVLEVKRAE